VYDARKTYEAYVAAWGDLPAISPHPTVAPGFSTGRVLGDLRAAADEIDRLRAKLKQVRAEQCGACRAYDDLGLKEFES
jgi:hypothetical protein